MIPRLRDLICKHRIIIYNSKGEKFGITCDNIIEAQAFVNRSIEKFHSSNIYNRIAGYRIEKV